MHWKLRNIAKRNKVRPSWMERPPCSWVGRLNVVKLSVLPKIIYRVKGIWIRIPVTIFVEMERSVLKLLDFQGALNSRTIEKNNKVMLHDFRTHYKYKQQCGNGIRIGLYIHHWNTIKDQVISPYIYG